MINAQRLKRDFERINGLSATDIGCTRLSYSDEDQKAREYILTQLEEIGVTAAVDSVGNLRARYPSGEETGPALLIGSHIDTVPYGGPYDGLAGALCSLEVLRVLHETKTALKHPVELVIFAEEEGSNFGVTMLGSKYISKKLTLEDLHGLHRSEGISAYAYIKSRGYTYHPEEDRYIDPENALGMIELHIEQGEVLDLKKKKIGIVEAIAGMHTLQVHVKGVSNHAGTTPMAYRKDALLAASAMILELSKLVEGYATAVITVGKIQVSPNASNVIASDVIFNVDIRDIHQNNIEDLTVRAQQSCKDLACKYGVNATFTLLGSSAAVRLDEGFNRVIEAQAEKREIPYMRMHSGAVHDNAMLTDLIPTAMIFVPSIRGISHSPEEDTDFDDILTGAELLLDSVKAIAGA